MKNVVCSWFVFIVCAKQAKTVRKKKNSDLVLVSLVMALEQQLTLAEFSCKNTLSNIATYE